MPTEDLLPFSQYSGTGIYPEPHGSVPKPHIHSRTNL